MGTYREELAWAAGFFDGEGNTHLNRGISGNDAYPRLQIGQSGDAEAMPEVLARFGAAVRCPPTRVNMNLSNRPNRRPHWKIGYHGYPQVIYVVSQMWPWLGEVKKQQAHKVLSAYVEWAQTHGRHIRRTHCSHGHEMTPENSYYNPANRGTKCRACRRIDPLTGVSPDGLVRSRRLP